MKLSVKHMHVVSKKLASGGFRAYAYAWRGGPRVGQADGVTKKAAQAALERVLGTEDGLAKIAAAQGSEAASKRSPRPCLLYTSPSPRDQRGSRMPSSA